ncbi:MAG: hypothetical protein DRI26_06635 [Chloroflexi bacterium]|nr:MAG: hypothetical protein DRI26_06635 [Chloroflexota bacterium]
MSKANWTELAKRIGIIVLPWEEVCLFDSKTSPMFCIRGPGNRLVRWLSREEEEKLIQEASNE